MTAEDIALRIFGLCVVSFPALMAAFKYAVLGDEGNLQNFYPGGKQRLSLLILMAYSLLLAAMVASADLLTETIGTRGDMAVFFLEAFGLIIGIPVINTLRHTADADWLRYTALGLYSVFWGYTIWIIGVALYLGVNHVL